MAGARRARYDARTRQRTLARTEFDGARLEALLGTLRQAHWHETPPPGPSRAFSFDSVLIDLRHAIRALRATPSFTIGALIVLALGTGATTAIFSVVDAVALRPLPFPEPHRIVAVGGRAAAAVGGAGVPQRPGPAPLGRGAMPGAKPPEPDALMSIAAQDYLDWEGSATGLRGDGSPRRHRRLRLSTSGRRTGVGEGRPRHGELLRRTPGAAHAGGGLHVTRRGCRQRPRRGGEPCFLATAPRQRFRGRRPPACAQWRVLHDRRCDAGGLRLSTRITPARRPLDAVGAASAGRRPRRQRRSLTGRASKHRPAESGGVARTGAGAAVPGCGDERRGQSHGQRRARHRHSPASRSPRRHLHAVVDAHAPCRRGHRAAHRVRERRKSVARARVGAAGAMPPSGRHSARAAAGWRSAS